MVDFMDVHDKNTARERRHHRAVLVRRILLGCAAIAFAAGIAILAGGTGNRWLAFTGLLLVFLAPLLVFMDLLGIGTFFEETEPENYPPEPGEALPAREASRGVRSYGFQH